MDIINFLLNISKVNWDVLIFAVIAIIGLVFLLVSFIIGEVLDIFGDFSIDIGGVDVSNVQSILAFVTGFGAVGWIASGYFHLNAAFASLIGLGGGVSLAIPISMMYRFMQKQSATSSYSLNDLVGTLGVIETPISTQLGSSSLGSVAYSFGGQFRSSTATANETLAIGTQVKIVSSIGGVLSVEKVR